MPRQHIPGFDDETPAARAPESSAKPTGTGEALNKAGQKQHLLQTAGLFEMLAKVAESRQQKTKAS